VIEHPLYALTIIDSAMGWFESIEISDKSIYTATTAFENVWLSCYPQPLFAIID